MLPLRRRVMLMVGRAVLTLVDDDPRLQVVQLSALRSETIDRAERFQEYGFSSHPEPGAEAVVVCPGGVRQHPIVIAVDDRRYRPTGLLEGEVVLYTNENTAAVPCRIALKRGPRIELRCGRSSIVMTDTDILLDSPHIGLND